MDRPPAPLVLILGAGINGAACARELVLNGVSVVVVDTADIAYGASSKSSRLIHGGLRYLEYGEFHLVRESLEERTRLLRQAPQFVRPLRLCIPVNNRLSGVLPTMLRFLKLEGWADSWSKRHQGTAANHKTRGMWLVRAGLKMYQIYARDRTMPKYSVHNTGEEGLPRVDAQKFPWLCAYSDGQIVNTERWILALFEDARQVAAEKQLRFDIHTYHRAEIDSDHVDIVSLENGQPITPAIQPSLIINATGAGGDATLKQLGANSPQLFAGTKGSHILTYNPRLKAALHEQGVYAEAPDNRLVFVLPFDDAVLVGTTDEPFDAPPETANATDDEINYLIGAVNDLFPNVDLTRGDVSLHYSGIRPLPKSSAKSPGAVTRRHWIEEQQIGKLPVLTLIGGKLTTCRALGEQTTDRVLELINQPRIANTRDRYVPGGKDYPANATALQAEIARLAESSGLSPDQTTAVWRLFGTQTAEVLKACPGLPGENLPGTHLPLPVIRWIIVHEWTSTLGDLVERRILLMFEPSLSRPALEQLATLLVESGKLNADAVDAAIETTIARLAEFYGITVAAAG
ncbi:Aerobic glycerol-3-phosphate dehydrogenase [Symmachiella dynata]|uniref:Aerobic glycerol-3-phosphate dehydrogenase n=1 Tax=Symmachiella dynata TaxID=2527995 RepID=A0A517ZLL8_9PLAN|nr:glycerol-3-phosphate dehydrogenase/oxidase [Symmachiella dynata]QDU43368.1 Aerobic glycerol-3-phosphate dehydrogenase [Symmachiella dynata]